METTALIAEDEPLLRERLAALLREAWSGLRIVAEARNGREAVELFEQHQPAVVFLDVHMPGMNGVEAARCIGTRAALVFVTAFDQYAVEAFARGAVDYLLKPVEPQRLAETVQRLQERLRAGQPQPALQPLLEQLAQHLQAPPGRGRWLQWIKASVGTTVRIIPVEQVLYLKSDNKYTLVAWEGGEALIRTPIRELAETLDPDRFVQIHRSAIVNLSQVSHFVQGDDAGEVHLRGRTDRLPVSRSYLHLFQRM